MIITDEALLRRSCTPATLEEAGTILATLEQELAQSAAAGRPGIGLAAPQIGILKTVAIVRIDGGHGRKYHVNLVNCRIAQGYDQSFFSGEGCLSFPDRYERTLRYQEIYVVDNLVEPYSFVATGLLAVCIQHELDHTRGILLPDLVPNSGKKMPQASPLQKL
jgi:peptide deformylase